MLRRNLTFVAALVLMASKASHFARAVNFCPSGTDPSYTHNVTTAGASDEAQSCSVGQQGSPSVLNINLRNIPAAPGAASVISFQGTVAPLSAVIVQFPSSPVALNAIPLQVTISDTTFEEASGLQIIGSLPASSSLTISGNTFAVAPQQGSWYVNAFTAIAIFPDSTTQDLNDNSQVTISDNTITGSGDLSTFNAAIGISWRGGVNYGSGVVVQIVRNSITLSCLSTLNPTVDQQACVVGLHMMANQFFTGFASSLAVDSNTFAITGGLVAALPPVSSFGTVVGTAVSFSENICQATTTGAVGTDAVTFGYISYGSDAQYSIRNNSFDFTGSTACNIGFSPMIPVDMIWGGGGEDPPTGMTDSASVIVANNQIQTSGCDGQIHIGRSHQLVSNSRFLINDNAITRSDQLGGSPAVLLSFSLTLQDDAAFSVSSNTWSAPSTSTDVRLIGFALSPSITVAGPAGSVRACGNELYGSLLNTDALVQARCPDALSAIVVSSECIVEGTEDTVQNTFATTSVAPTGGDTLAPTTSADANTVTDAPILTTTVVGQTTTSLTDSPITPSDATEGSSTTTPDFLNNTLTTSTQPSVVSAHSIRIASCVLLLVFVTYFGRI